jgi:hypothetical protein
VDTNTAAKNSRRQHAETRWIRSIEARTVRRTRAGGAKPPLAFSGRGLSASEVQAPGIPEDSQRGEEASEEAGEKVREETSGEKVRSFFLKTRPRCGGKTGSGARRGRKGEKAVADNRNMLDPSVQEQIRRRPHEYVRGEGKHGTYVEKPYLHQEFPKVMDRTPKPEMKNFRGKADAEKLYQDAVKEWDELQAASVVNSRQEEQDWLAKHGPQTEAPRPAAGKKTKAA